MKVLLTGGTGYIGSAVLAALVARGHEVTALVRSEGSARTVEAAGATPAVVDLTDTTAVATLLADADAAVHAAAASDGSSPTIDASVVDAVLATFDGTDRPFVHTSGIWVYGNGEAIDEDSPLDPPAIVAWRLPIEERLLAATAQGRVAGSVVVPGVVYGHGAGIPGIVAGAPRREGPDGASLTLVGSGTQRWATVHVDDLAELYVHAVEQGLTGRLLGTADGSASVIDLTRAASRAAGLGGAVGPEDEDATRERLGAPFADALLLDQRVAPVTRARVLGWSPSRPSLVEELETGSYAPAVSAH
ncbi:NAD-dependent epimerase/dehydratase family protein [Oerskovia enterophila]|uniref:UDP-glucose 4-epimerase n=1 Tax=Oerskovia enterophila TaxID=43678 RepID=A0ABX2XZW0_9CELL|nr:NAD-dependent epimerase/dehydratase family protein [Oerskovia enterophila]OCI29848.1 UDP-glucose 4-epimerase [Oerskovia enterophila]